MPKTTSKVAGLTAALLAATVIAEASASDCTIVNGRVRGDCAGVSLTIASQDRFLHIDGYHREDGVILGARIVKSGQLILSGISKGDILVEGGSLVVKGIVNGAIRSKRGSLRIEGIVNGAITSSGGDVTVSGGVVDRIKSDTEVHFANGAVVRTSLK